MDCPSGQGVGRALATAARPGHPRRCEATEDWHQHMKKPPRRKPKGLKPTAPRPTEVGFHTQPKPQATQERTPQREKTGSRLRIRERYRTFWAYAGPIFTLVSAGALWWPSVTITSGANLDPSQDFQTQVLINNNGKSPVYDMSITCDLVGEEAYIGKLQTPERPIPKIPTLRAGEVASRGCLAASKYITGLQLRVHADFTWPIIGRRDRVTSYFSVERGPTGSVLVPQARPTIERKATITIPGEH